MKLTLSVGGGFTGLTQQSSIDVDSLDENTRAALLNYIDKSGKASPKNWNENWILDDEKEVPIDNSKLSDELKQLYNRMKENLSYPRH
jgi:hypothetical protein